MSYQDFCKAMKLAPKCRFYETDSGAKDSVIQKAESLLGVRFSKQCREFYTNYNYLSFYGQEIYGVDPEKLDVLVGNSVGATLSARKKWGLPAQWILFLDYGSDDTAVYMDYSQLNADGEPRIIEAVYTNGEHLDEYNDEGFEEGQEPEGYCRYMVNEVLAEDFGQFLLKLVEEELAEQQEVPVKKESTTGGKPYDFSDYTLEDIKAKLAEINATLAQVNRDIEARNEKRAKLPWLAHLFKKD